MKIRDAKQEDAGTIQSLYLVAFPEGEGGLISELSMGLLLEKRYPPVLSLVAEVGGAVVGHVAFSPVFRRDTKQHIGYILSPLAVCPNFQKQGIASLLIQTGIERITVFGSGVLLVYGDPEFYGRFGFRAADAECYEPPYRLEFPDAWQGMALGEYDVPTSAVEISCVSSLGNPALW